MSADALTAAGTCMFDDAVMAAKLPAAVVQRFNECLITGAPTTEEDQKVISEAIFEWARERGAIDFAHWFFPLRGGGGAVGGMLGAFKKDTLMDLEFGSQFTTKPMKACLPHERLFQGETDGSSFPNGGLRVTHSAAAFTTWDRSSPPFVMDSCLYIPCAFVTHFGKCIDEKTPLLRSMDAVKTHGLRLLQAIGIGKDAQTMHSYLGWEQEFFVLSADHFKARPDLVNCGRTLFGRLPTRHQQGDLNYFQAIPGKVQELLDVVQAEMLKIGCPMAVKHNEVAPGQHEMSPVFRAANVSCDSNVCFMEVMNREAAKLGLQVLFHEKPFAGINGSGKHANWSIGTDTGLNFFYPGKNEDGAKLYVTAIACLAYGLAQYNEMVRCTVASAGNDHRLGAQEAPPAIISLYPGQGFESFVDSVVSGGDLLGYKAEKKKQETGCSSAMHIEANVEDRNRTAPFPFCGNRFEFRAVGSSQNCCLPIMVCNAVMSAGMSHMASLIEGGMSHRDAVAQVFKENKHVIFTGNGYSAEWPVEASKRGLPNLNTTPKAIATWSSEKNTKLLETLKIYTKEETEARQEVMYENYISCICCEVETMIQMVETGFLPACAKDLDKYKGVDKLTGSRKTVYENVVDQVEKLQAVYKAKPHTSLAEEATYLCDTVKAQMAALRAAVDKAETMIEASLYPFPTYEQMIYSHHF
ncbi:glnA3 [Symbiodinium sp. CCMP2592]|nr:glnA3 [Symbiodinium sp. CCMP2592]